MSTANGINATTPKVGKYGSVQKPRFRVFVIRVLASSQGRGVGQEERREDGSDRRLLESQAGHRSSRRDHHGKLQNSKETIGERDVTDGCSLRALIWPAEALDVELTEEEAKYLEES